MVLCSCLLKGLLLLMVLGVALSSSYQCPAIFRYETQWPGRWVNTATRRCCGQQPATLSCGSRTAVCWPIFRSGLTRVTSPAQYVSSGYGYVQPL